MIRSLITAALVLGLGLTAAGCGGMERASTAAHRWNDAQVQQRLARGGPEMDDGAYHADDKGHVEGFREEEGSSGEDSLTRAGEDLLRKAEEAGRDLARDAGEAGRSIGSAADRALDQRTGLTAGEDG